MDRNEAAKIIDDAVRQMIEEAGPTDATAIVCNPKDHGGVYFDDDLFDTCKTCGVEVRYRPYMPDLPKVCIECVGRSMEAARCRN